VVFLIVLKISSLRVYQVHFKIVYYTTHNYYYVLSRCIWFSSRYEPNTFSLNNAKVTQLLE